MSIKDKVNDDFFLEQARSRNHRNRLLEWQYSFAHKEIPKWHRPFAVTLRFKEGTIRQNIEPTVKHFLNTLNEKVFKHAFKRYGKELRRICKAEWSRDQKDPHLHMTLESPSSSRMSEQGFCDLVKDLWNRTDKGIVEISCYDSKIKAFDMKKMSSNEWIGYISKRYTTLSGDDILINTWKV